jgi:hypothetical protein
MKRLTLTVVPAIVIFLMIPAILRAQGGPPPKVKEKINQANEGVNPFVSEAEMISRFEKEFGIPKEVYTKVKETWTNYSESSESGHDLSEKPKTEVMLTLIVAGAKVNSGEKTGKYKVENRKADLIAESDRIIDRRKSHNGWGGIAEEAGLEDPGQLFAVQRAIEFGQPLNPDLKKKLDFQAQTQTAPQ